MLKLFSRLFRRKKSLEEICKKATVSDLRAAVKLQEFLEGINTRTYEL